MLKLNSWNKKKKNKCGKKLNQNKLQILVIFREQINSIKLILN